MSDMAPQFYNAWVAVMGDPRPIKLICTWHVDKAWKEELRKKIGDISIEAEVYKMLRIVLQQPEENTFKHCLQALRKRTPGWDAPKNGTFSVSGFSDIKFQNGRSFVCMDLHINQLEYIITRVAMICGIE